MSITNSNLDFWIKNNYNVLFRGRHGIGKTSIILEAFNRNKLKSLYFSAATMDPWVDFIGVPKEKIDGDKTYLELVRPRAFEEDSVEALFFDEFNRAPKKVRNAVMELIQFKAINGKKFKNLKIVWAAINPSSENSEEQEYDVEDLDPAQEDRFQIFVDLPYKPIKSYFNTKYGAEGLVAVEWWDGLPEDLKDKVSPRRLDYALDVFKNGGDMRYVLPQESNISKLITQLSFGSFSKMVQEVFEAKNVAEAKKMMASENIFEGTIEMILKKEEYIQFFFPFFPREKISNLLISDSNLRSFMITSMNYDDYADIVNPIIASKLAPKRANKDLIVWRNTSPTHAPKQNIISAGKLNINSAEEFAKNFYRAKKSYQTYGRIKAIAMLADYHIPKTMPLEFYTKIAIAALDCIATFDENTTLPKNKLIITTGLRKLNTTIDEMLKLVNMPNMPFVATQRGVTHIGDIFVNGGGKNAILKNHKQNKTDKVERFLIANGFIT